MFDIRQTIDCYLLEEEQLLQEAHQWRPANGKPHESNGNFIPSIDWHMCSMLDVEDILLLIPSLQEDRIFPQILLQESEKSWL
jgi:hypothetical protein